MMHTQRPDSKFTHVWHVAINQGMKAIGFDKGRFMYDARHAADELPRLTLLFGMEREGKLLKVHRQCSHAAPEPVAENYLTCCLGQRCSACPMLKALDAIEGRTPEEVDHAKAWTCVSHILANGGDWAGEGYVLTVDDRMYWDRLHANLAMRPDDEADEAAP